MNLTIPSLPPILTGYNEELWRKWFGFWCLPFESKSIIVDYYPELVVKRTSQLTTRAYFVPEILDTKIKSDLIFSFWKKVQILNDYPLQEVNNPINFPDKFELFNQLNTLNFSVLAYKFRYEIRSENYEFEMDYHKALLDACSISDLQSFYKPLTEP